MLNSTVLAEYSYDAYGNHLSETENGISNPIRYAGYYYDYEIDKDNTITIKETEP